MNISIKNLPHNCGYGLKSTQDRLERQASRDRQIEFFEGRKKALKNMGTETIEDIGRKLDLLQGYNERITGIKKEFNNSQMFKALDEAMELGEKIAEEAEKYEPKTPEERMEEMRKEASGMEENDGLLSEILEETEEILEEMESDTDILQDPESLENDCAGQDAEMIKEFGENSESMYEGKELSLHYRHFDYKI